jgi:3-oxoacyl-[acyl-carrier protein] reductase
MTRKTAIVFGGSRGIGAAVVAALSRDGFDVALTYTSTAPEAPPGDGITLHRCDIRDPADVAAVFSAVPRPDCVVANAGINVPPGPIAQFPDFPTTGSATWSR